MKLPFLIGLALAIAALGASRMSNSKVANAILAAEPIPNYAILIGINDYQDPQLADLQNPTGDVAAIAAELENRYGFVTDTLNNPSRSKIRAKFSVIRNGYENYAYDPEGQLLIFLSGHGSYDDFSKTGYFLPADCQSNDLDATSFSYDKWQRYINNLNCKHVLVIIDACFSGTFDEDVRMRGSSGRDFGRPNEYSDNEKLLEEHQRRATRLFLSSGAKEETPDKSNLAANLLEAIQLPEYVIAHLPETMLAWGQHCITWRITGSPFPQLRTVSSFQMKQIWMEGQFTMMEIQEAATPSLKVAFFRAI